MRWPVAWPQSLLMDSEALPTVGHVDTGRPPSAKRGSMEARRYEFRVAERFSATAAAAFPELNVADTAAGTVLFGRLRDSSELYGVLSRFDLLGMTVLDVHRLPD